jgi:hypothetical protein
MRKPIYVFCAVICAMGLREPAARAQQQAPDREPPPAIPGYQPALGSTASAGETQEANTEPNRPVPDTRSLSGAQELSLGFLPASHNYFQPHADVQTTVDSNALSPTQNSGLTTWTFLSGGIELHRNSGDSEMTLNYIGGGRISNDGTSDNGILQGLDFGSKFSWRRTDLSFFDKLSYLPESEFGYGGTVGFPSLGGGLPGLQPGFTPSQSILTTSGQRLSNTFLTQVDEHLTPRSSLTFLGGYSLLRFLDNNLFDSSDTVFQAGYNYRVTREDTLALLYHLDLLNFGNSNQSIKNHSLQVSYGRRVTSRLAIQVAAGPQVSFFQGLTSPGPGSPGGAHPTGCTGLSSTSQICWTLYTSLQYQIRRTGLGLLYNHVLTGGSGVLTGAISDQVTGTVSRQLARTLNGVWTVGYARNQGLASGASNTSNQAFDYWFTGVNFTHPWGRRMNLFLGYQLQYQNSNASFCVGATCGSSFIRHQVSLGFSWRERPIAF